MRLAPAQKWRCASFYAERTCAVCENRAQSLQLTWQMCFWTVNVTRKRHKEKARVRPGFETQTPFNPAFKANAKSLSSQGYALVHCFLLALQLSVCYALHILASRLISLEQSVRLACRQARLCSRLEHPSGKILHLYLGIYSAIPLLSGHVDPGHQPQLCLSALTEASAILY